MTISSRSEHSRHPADLIGMLERAEHERDQALAERDQARLERDQIGVALASMYEGLSQLADIYLDLPRPVKQAMSRALAAVRDGEKAG